MINHLIQENKSLENFFFKLAGYQKCVVIIEPRGETKLKTPNLEFLKPYRTPNPFFFVFLFWNDSCLDLGIRVFPSNHGLSQPRCLLFFLNCDDFMERRVKNNQDSDMKR